MIQLYKVWVSIKVLNANIYGKGRAEESLRGEFDRKLNVAKLPQLMNSVYFF